MIKAWFISNGYFHSGSTEYVKAAFERACRRHGVALEVITSNKVPYKLYGGNFTLDLPKPDFVIFWDKDVALARSLELMGVRVFNSARAVAVCDDKIKTACALAGSGLEMPETIFAPTAFPGAEGLDKQFLDRVEASLGYPVVVKEASGSFGGQVYLAKDRDELEKLRQRLLCKPHLYQKFIATSEGKDARVIVVGGKAVANMVRINDKDFRANVELGGQAVYRELEPSYIEAAEKAARLIGLDYAGVDLLFGEEGPLVCEVNSNAFFRGIEGCVDIDVAEIYLRHILTSIEVQI